MDCTLAMACNLLHLNGMSTNRSCGDAITKYSIDTMLKATLFSHVILLPKTNTLSSLLQ